SLTVINVTTAMNSYRYRVIVSGTCPPAVTSNAVTLVVATPPTITTHPVSVTVCAKANASFSVVAAGIPAPTLYQWQVSTAGAGGPWTNLTVASAYTASLTLVGVATTQNAYQYRVIVTNNCGQTVTSNPAILTVNALPVISAGTLPSRICISDTLIALSGSPIGGSWKGIGISGFNFVPAATAVGGPYTLTYTYTNTLGCTDSARILATVQACPERARLLREGAVIVYPNPNKGNFYIRMNSTLYNYIGVRVYNAAGVVVNGTSVNDVLTSPTYSGLVYGRVIPINLSHLPSGTYLVKVYYEDGVRTAEESYPVLIMR
ncbi:MAG: T9SS type A sorting domain-containing protein, partial [Chitinophagaceae bacterium]